MIGDAHGKCLDEQDIHQNVARGGRGEEQERRAGIAHRRENACGHIVEKQKGQAEQIDMQIQQQIQMQNHMMM